MRKSQKHFLVVLIIIAAIVLLGSIYLSLFFPYDQVRSWMKRETRETIGVNLELGRMHFSLFGGLSIEDIFLADIPSPSPFLQIKKLTIDYDLWALLAKKIKIKQILLDSPQINLVYQDEAWNLERIAGRLKKEKSAPPQPTKKISKIKPEVIGLPLEIDLEDFFIENPQIFMDKPGKFQATVAGIDIRIKGSLGEKSSHLVIGFSNSSPNTILKAKLPDISLETRPKANLQILVDNFQKVSAAGELGWERMLIEPDKDIPPLSLAAKIKADLDLLHESARLSLLDINLNQSQRLNLSADIRELFTTPEISAQIKKLNINLGPLWKIAAAYFPKISIKGELELKDFFVQGNINEDKTIGILHLSNGQARFKGVECSVPSRQVEIKQLNGIVNLKETAFAPPSIIPHTLQWNFDVDCQKAKIAGFQAETIKGSVGVESEDKNQRNKQIHMRISAARLRGDQIHPFFLEEIGVTGKIREIEWKKNRPASGKLFVKGQFKSGRISDMSLSGFKATVTGDIKHPDLTESDLNIKINLENAKTSGKKAIQTTGFNARIHLDDLLLAENALKKIRTKITFNNRSVSLADRKIGAENIAGTLLAHASGEELENHKLEANFSLNRIHFDVPETGPQEVSLKLSAKTNGDFLKGDIAMDPLRFEIDDFGEGTYAAEISNFDEFSLSGALVLDLNKMTRKFSQLIQDTAGEADSRGKLIISSELKNISSDSVESQRKFDRSKPSQGIETTHSSSLLDFESKVRFQDTGLMIQQPPVTLENLHSNLDIRGRYSIPEGIKDIILAGTVGFERVNFPKLAAMDNGMLTLSFSSVDQQLSGSTLFLDFKGFGARSLKRDFKTYPMDLSFNLQSKQSLPRKAVQLEKMVLQIAEKVYLECRGRIEEWGERFDLNLDGKLPNLGWVIKQTPERIGRKLPFSEINGTTDFQFHAAGKKPTDEEIDKFNIPVNVAGTITGNKIHFIYPAKNLTIDNLQLNTNLSHQEGAARISGRLDLENLSPEKDLGPLGLIYKIYLEPGFDRLQIEKGTQLTLAGEQIRLDIDGDFDGLNLFIKPENNLTPESVLKNVSVNLGTGLTGSAEKNLDLKDDFSIQGQLENKLEINLNPGRFLDIEGMLFLNNFHARHGDRIQLEKMTLKFPYRKRFYLFKIPEKEKDVDMQFPLPLQETFSSLERFSQTRNNLRIHRFKLGKIEVRNIFGDLTLKGESIGAKRFGMDLFGGGVGGNFIIFSDPENHVIQFSTEFSGIGFDSVIPGMYRTGNPQDTISGNFKLVSYLDRRVMKEKIDLKRIDLHLRITRIGYASLNQLLLFLDPEESNPSILNARDTLKWATPVMVDFQIAYGNISLALELESKVLGGARFSLPVLNRIPLDLLKNFDKIDVALNKLAPLNQFMEILAAKGVAIDEGNKVKFLQ